MITFGLNMSYFRFTVEVCIKIKHETLKIDFQDLRIIQSEECGYIYNVHNYYKQYMYTNFKYM